MRTAQFLAQCAGEFLNLCLAIGLGTLSKLVIPRQVCADCASLLMQRARQALELLPKAAHLVMQSLRHPVQLRAHPAKLETQCLQRSVEVAMADEHVMQATGCGRRLALHHGPARHSLLVHGRLHGLRLHAQGSGRRAIGVYVAFEALVFLSVAAHLTMQFFRKLTLALAGRGELVKPAVETPVPNREAVMQVAKVAHFAAQFPLERSEFVGAQHAVCFRGVQIRRSVLAGSDLLGQGQDLIICLRRADVDSPLELPAALLELPPERGAELPDVFDAGACGYELRVAGTRHGERVAEPAGVGGRKPRTANRRHGTGRVLETQDARHHGLKQGALRDDLVDQRTLQLKQRPISHRRLRLRQLLSRGVQIGPITWEL
mmetsp:Transcript_12890/g.34595  ORF Transcript_12890/g.34595 Transcript_12890/m.34595 type:complete len:375 (-) Transcript_12890:86-1210(-)